MLEVDLTRQFVLARAIGRGMVERGRGKIIFTASLLSFQGGINVPGYTAAKSGMAGLTKALANEWAAHGVNVNAIAPGLHRDRQHPGAAGRSRSAARAILDASRPAGGARPDDLAGATVFLASPASDYVNGIGPAGRRRVARAMSELLEQLGAAGRDARRRDRRRRDAAAARLGAALVAGGCRASR